MIHIEKKNMVQTGWVWKGIPAEGTVFVKPQCGRAAQPSPRGGRVGALEAGEDSQGLQTGLWAGPRPEVRSSEAEAKRRGCRLGTGWPA